jgi:histidinol-phosphate aminotransferase
MAHGSGWVDSDDHGDDARAPERRIDLDHHGDDDLDPQAGDGQLHLAVNVRLPRPPPAPAGLAACTPGGLVGRAGGLPAAGGGRRGRAARHRRDPAQVLLTNGAAEAFTLLARGLQPRHAVCVHPSFTAPEAALRDAGHPVERVLLPPRSTSIRAGAGRR